MSGNNMADGKKSSEDEDPNIVRSPLCGLAAKIKVPDGSMPDLIFKAMDMNCDILKDDIWVMDVIKGTSYKFREIKPMSRKIASALTRIGFKKGDVLYFVTYDTALMYMIEIGVWLCGGAVRGCFQREEQAELERQMREVQTHFILCDSHTARTVKQAAQNLGWPFQFLSIGQVEGAICVEEMIEKEDCSAFPSDVKINPKEDIISLPNTSGSTGSPKGAIHTHHNFIEMAASFGFLGKISEERKWGHSLMSLAGNFAVGSLLNVLMSIFCGFTLYGLSRFDQKTFLQYVMQCKPETIFLYPYVLNWFARAPEVDAYDLSFVKNIMCVGSVLDIATAKIIKSRFPFLKLMQSYASTEALICTSSKLIQQADVNSTEDNIVAGLKFKKFEEEFHVSCGPLLPLVEAKIMDEAKGCSVGRLTQGSLWVKNPYLMKGYLNEKSKKGLVTNIVDGWLMTGDLGYFDEAGHLYILERSSFIFKYYMHQVSPSELESVISEHPAVLSVGVIGVPNAETTSAARAYVILKTGFKATEEEIKAYVAERKIFYKHLHGGVVFVDSLPESRGGKLDRPALLKKAIAEMSGDSP